MPELAERWTREMVLALPDDGKRYELLDGELLVTPAPTLRHQAAAMALVRRLDPYVRSNLIGWLGYSPADLALEGGQLAQPDIFVLGLHEGRLPRNWSEAGVPLLAIEVLSPSTARYDRGIKRRRYQRSGVAEYWVVDLDAGLIERWRPGDERPEPLDEIITWEPDPSKPAVSISLPELFAEIPEDA